MSGAPRLPVGAPDLTPHTARMAAGPGAAVHPLVSYVLVKIRLTRGPSRVLSSRRCRDAIAERAAACWVAGETKDDGRHGFCNQIHAPADLVHPTRRRALLFHGGRDRPERYLGPHATDLRGLGEAIGQRPRAILVISGHWEEARPTVTAGWNPPLLFDYYGFPEHTYRLTYPAPGSPELSQRV
jgi:hypothetical protein